MILQKSNTDAISTKFVKKIIVGRDAGRRFGTTKVGVGLRKLLAKVTNTFDVNQRPIVRQLVHVLDRVRSR